jgi:hypothetical protein
MSDEESKARRDTICLFEVKLDAHSPTAALEMRAHLQGQGCNVRIHGSGFKLRDSGFRI